MFENFVLKIVTAVSCKKGVSALEYGILAAVVIGAVAAAATVLSGDISSAFTEIGTKLSAAQSAAAK